MKSIERLAQLKRSKEEMELTLEELNSEIRSLEEKIGAGSFKTSLGQLTITKVDCFRVQYKAMVEELVPVKKYLANVNRFSNPVHYYTLTLKGGK
jgi:hypothetical protein